MARRHREGGGADLMPITCATRSSPKRSARRFCSRPWSARASWRNGSPAETARSRCSATRLPTGAILAVLILIFGPVSGAHFNPAVSIAFALRREIAVAGRRRLYRGADRRRHRWRLGRASDVRVAALAGLGNGAHRPGPMARRIRRDLRPAADDLRLRRAHSQRPSPTRSGSISPLPIGSRPRRRSPTRP